MNIAIILIVFSSIAVTSCVFLASYFLIIRNEHKIKDVTLGLLFITIALRIAKSIFYYALPEISAIGIAFGFLGFALIGPLAYVYFLVNKKTIEKLKPIIYLHILFPIIGFTVIVINRDFGYDFYFLANISLISYLTLISKRFVFTSNTAKLNKWDKTLFYSLVTLAAILVYQLLGATMANYAIGIGLSSLVLYFLFFFALQSPTVIKKTNKTIPKPLLEKVKKAIEQDNIYLQPSITLANFSDTIDTPTYIVSKAIKALYNKSFPEVINSFRIKAITKKLSEPDHANEKIENLAYDVGFNTTSAFYNAFKKETSMSPRAYQNAINNKVFNAN